jgi:hypothetical protein
MKLLKTFDRSVADKVLDTLEIKLASKRGADLHVWLYENGREHGYAVENGEKVVVFSEYRNSDQIVLYTGKAIVWSLSQSINDEMYNRKTFYNPDDIAGVVMDIVKFLTKKVK